MFPLLAIVEVVGELALRGEVVGTPLAEEKGVIGANNA